jgi:hypothetical protein
MHLPSPMKIFWLLLLATLSALAQTNAPSVPAESAAIEKHTAEIRTDCINGRRCICGKVIQIVPDGVIVESGYTDLLKPEFNESWVVSERAMVKRDPKLLERAEPASPCIGTIFLTDIPKRPKVKLYEYVVLQAYPAGTYQYIPVPGVEKTVRKFAAGLDTAVKLRLAAAGN